MSPKLVKVNATYVNRGKGRTRRLVIAITTDKISKPKWYSAGPRPKEPVVVYMQSGECGSGLSSLYLSSFAKWCGKEITV